MSRGVFMLGNVDGSLEHSTRFALIDGSGRIRGYYQTSEPEAIPTLIADAKRLLKEQHSDRPPRSSRLNATLNGTAAVLLIIAFVLIKQGRREAHKRVMLAAFAVSSLFLICYLIYHAQVGSVHYPHTGVDPHRLPDDPDHAHHPGRERPRTGDHHAAPRAQRHLHPPQSHRPLDPPHLALRQRDRRGGLPDAVSVLT